MGNKLENKTNKPVRIVPGIPQPCEEALPYVEEIRRSWSGNKSHCEGGYKSNRKTFTDNATGFCDEWLGELGFIRYYLFHIDAGYTPGVHMLERISRDKGFSPENCRVVLDPKRRNKSIDGESKNTNISLADIEKLPLEQKMIMFKQLLRDVDIQNNLQ